MFAVIFVSNGDNSGVYELHIQNLKLEAEQQFTEYFLAGNRSPTRVSGVSNTTMVLDGMVSRQRQLGTQASISEMMEAYAAEFSVDALKNAK